MRPFRFTVLLTVLAACLLVACGGDDGGGGTGEPAVVRVQDTAGVPSAFLEYGVKEGLFEKRQLDVEVTPSQGGATVVPAVVAGDTDIGGSNLVSVLLAQSKDIPVKIGRRGPSSAASPTRTSPRSSSRATATSASRRTSRARRWR